MSSRAERILNLALQKLQQNKPVVPVCHENLVTDENLQIGTIQILEENLDINNLPIDIVQNSNILQLNEIGEIIEVINWADPAPNEGEPCNENDFNKNIYNNLPYQDEREVGSPVSEENSDHSDTDYAPHHDIEDDSDDHNYGSDQEQSYNHNENLDVQDTHGMADCGDMNEGRKRSKLANKTEWKRIKNQQARMKGKEYLGFSRANKKFQHSVPRAARQIGQRCSSKMCLTSKKRFCKTITEEARNEMFSKFWNNMTWDQRKVYVSGYISLQNTSRKTTQNESRRGNTLIYRMHNGQELV